MSGVFAQVTSTLLFRRHSFAVTVTCPRAGDAGTSLSQTTSVSETRKKASQPVRPALSVRALTTLLRRYQSTECRARHRSRDEHARATRRHRISNTHSSTVPREERLLSNGERALGVRFGDLTSASSRDRHK